jgi:peptidoglycan/xylan/chitin deacetylase (PgdA/CDA1 family)
MVSDAQLAHVKHYKYLGTAEFERDLRSLEGRFEFVTYKDIAERRLQREDARDTSVCLTFDDGFAECASAVRPILLRHGASCIFFVITDLIDNRGVFLETQASLCVDAIQNQPPELIEEIVRDFDLEARLQTIGSAPYQGVPSQMALEWQQFDSRIRLLIIWLLTIRPSDVGVLDGLSRRLGVDAAGYVSASRPYLSTEQILQLRSDGFTIGAHGCSHRRLQELTLAEAEHEIVESCRIVRDLTGQASVPFAFPYFGGGLDRFWLEKLRKQYPFIGLFFDTQGLRRDAPFVVQRVFGERIEETGPIDRLLRRAWMRRLL